MNAAITTTGTTICFLPAAGVILERRKMKRGVLYDNVLSLGALSIQVQHKGKPWGDLEASGPTSNSRYRTGATLQALPYVKVYKELRLEPNPIAKSECYPIEQLPLA
jgi:hypothetical protein